MARRWTSQQILDLTRSFQPACVLAAAAGLDVFGTLRDKPMTSRTLACSLATDPRATTILLDALAALELLEKQDDNYGVPADVAGLLSDRSPDSVLPMVRHMANCLGRWARLCEVEWHGLPAREPTARMAVPRMPR